MGEITKDGDFFNILQLELTQNVELHYKGGRLKVKTTHKPSVIQQVDLIILGRLPKVNKCEWGGYKKLEYLTQCVKIKFAFKYKAFSFSGESSIM